jgi:hypothetical protein
MAKFNIAGLLTGMETALKAVNEMMPVAQKFGVPAIVANVSTIAIAAIGIGHNVLERAQGVKDALSEQDETKLRGMLSDLQAVNDRLAGQIAEDATEAADEGSAEPQGGGDGT